jgi:hypothetical protein
VDSPGSEQGSLVDCCECGDELSGSVATDLVQFFVMYIHVRHQSTFMCKYSTVTL